MKDKRIFQRLKKRANIRCTIDNYANEEIPVNIIDIGGGGIQISSPFEFPIGTELELDVFQEDQSDPICLYIQTLWIKKNPSKDIPEQLYLIGTKFTQPNLLSISQIMF